jgi:hypothetical protein
MPMLEPHEYLAGTLMDAKPGTLLLPSTRSESRFLVGTYGEKIYAVFLDGHLTFHSMDCKDAGHAEGLLIPNVRVLVDPSSVIDPRQDGPRAGMLIRHLDKLSIWTIGQNRFSHNMARIDLVSDLPPSASAKQVGFLRWQIVLGKWTEQRVLFEMDLRDKNEGG